VSGLPVVDEDGTVLGVVSEGDILAKERGLTGSHSLLGHLLEADNSEVAKHSARDAADAMTTPAVTIRPSRTISEAAALMLDRRVNRLPVVDRTRGSSASSHAPTSFAPSLEATRRSRARSART
jgi:CBS domain-containing protein